MTDSTNENTWAEVHPHYSFPNPVTYFIEIYDNGMMVEQKVILIPSRRWANFRAKAAVKRYRRNRFKPSKDLPTIIR